MKRGGKRWTGLTVRGEREPTLAEVHGFDPANEDPNRTPNGVRNWLIWEGKSECWWGPNKGGYWKSLEHAGLYTEAEAKAQQAASERTKGDRKDVAVPLSSKREAIERLYAALHAGDDPPDGEQSKAGTARSEPCAGPTAQPRLLGDASSARSVPRHRLHVDAGDQRPHGTALLDVPAVSAQEVEGPGGCNESVPGRQYTHEGT